MIRAFPLVLLAFLLFVVPVAGDPPPPPPPPCPCEVTKVVPDCPTPVKVGDPVVVRVLVRVKKLKETDPPCPPLTGNGFYSVRNSENKEVAAGNIQEQGAPILKKGGEATGDFIITIKFNQRFRNLPEGPPLTWPPGSG
ncbi:MAG: hypothetical protein HUU15_16660 [Candidatus Brocadiae bacterium]|nr:hypothetical protein [Candidatus Brocadiia bacterium]